MSHHLVTLLLGSNLGSPRENIEKALGRIQSDLGPVIGRSPVLDTDPVEFVSNNIFCNIAILIKTQFSPIKLLNLIKKIEKEMGRADDSLVTKKYEDRVIDIDIVLYGGITFESAYLKIPHIKHLHKRDFSRKLLSSIEKL